MMASVMSGIKQMAFDTTSGGKEADL